MKSVSIHTICFSAKASKEILECTVYLLTEVDEAPRLYTYYNIAEAAIKTNKTQSIPEGLDVKLCNN